MIGLIFLKQKMIITVTIVPGWYIHIVQHTSFTTS